MSNEWLCENIEDLQDSEIEEEKTYETTNWDIQKIEVAEFENYLVASGYYQRMRCLNG